MKAVQEFFHSYSYLRSDFFSKIFLTLVMLFSSGLESKNKQNTDNIKALQVTYIFPKFTLQPNLFFLILVVFIKTGLFRYHLKRLFSYHYTFVGIYPPTPPLSQHFALSEKYVLVLA